MLLCSPFVACSSPSQEGQQDDAKPEAAAQDTTKKKKRRTPPPFDPIHPIAHDPVVAVEGDTVYAFTTGFGISQLHTTDMERWESDGPCLDSLPSWVRTHLPEAGMHIWAPDIIRHGGRWHLFYSCSAFGKNTSLIGHASTKSLNRHSADYGWRDEGMVVQSVPHRDNWNAIDPNIIISPDGSAWMTFGSFWGGIKMVRLNEDLSGIAEPQEWHTLASRPRTDMSTDDEPGDGAIEAPFIVQHDGWYYLFASFDYCCRGEESTYHVVCGRSRTVTGPYVDSKGQRMDMGGGTRIELKGDDKDRYVAAGHCAVATVRGKDYIIMHGYRRSDGAPELMFRPINWHEDGSVSIAY